MSFSSEVKEQLTRVNTSKDCCNRVEFVSFLRMSGNITFGFGGKLGATATTANITIAKRYFRFAREILEMEAEMMLHKTNNLRKSTLYTLRLPPQEKVRDLIDLMSKIPDGSPWSAGAELKNIQDLKGVFGGECCYRAYLRGAFLGNGFINNPKKSYHLEVVCNNLQHGTFLMTLMSYYGMNPKINDRRNQCVIYLKESENISDFLNVIGAHKALLELENIKLYKELANSANRAYNCDIANTNKIVNTGTRQLLALEKIAAEIGLDKLPENLAETARLRLENPESSLQELCEMFDPPLSKSGVNHRLRKLEQIAENFKPTPNRKYTETKKVTK
ncbi:MAG: DNA-binding protein WhiA [Bacillota bacterium]|jgi:DNA-binding protein WhiA